MIETSLCDWPPSCDDENISFKLGWADHSGARPMPDPKVKPERARGWQARAEAKRDG